MQIIKSDIKADIQSWFWVLALVAVLQAFPDTAIADEMTPNEAQSGRPQR